MVLHELNDDPDVVAVVLDGDHPHDVGRVFRVRIRAVLEQKIICIVHGKTQILWLISLQMKIVLFGNNGNAYKLFNVHSQSFQHLSTLLASTRQASASCTLARSRSTAFISEP